MAEEKKQAALKIVIDDGSQRIPIENMNGDEIGVFYFHPTDVGIIERYNETMSKFDEIVAPLEEININADGTGLYEACDYIFGGNMSEAFFGKMHPFSPVGGLFYCESALNKVGAFISEQFEQETTKINSRLKQYVGKYGKGKK